MAKRLYVGNLPYETQDEDLKQLFGEFGEVTGATVMRDKYSGRSKGFGFVEMAADDAAIKAKEKLNGTVYKTRNIVVDEARPMKEGGGDRGPREHRSGGFRRRE